MPARGYQRNGWRDPKPGSHLAIMVDLLKSRAATTEEIKKATGGRNPQALGYLRDFCGYIIVTWPDLNLDHTRKAKRRYRIVGRLSWSGGVAEDYMVNDDVRRF